MMLLQASHGTFTYRFKAFSVTLVSGLGINQIHWHMPLSSMPEDDISLKGVRSSM